MNEIYGDENDQNFTGPDSDIDMNDFRNPVPDYSYDFDIIGSCDGCAEITQVNPYGYCEFCMDDFESRKKCAKEC